MDWLWVALNWYIALFVLGIIFFPFVGRFFSSFFDRGYAFSKTVAILVLTYVTFVLGTVKILPFTQIGLFFLIGIFVVVSAFLIKKKKLKLDFPLRVLIFEELLFLAAFLFLAFVRGQEPSIRGLEKFMDFGFMNSILRSRYFPPLDMWLSKDPTHPAGYPINYYYFGHLSGAFLIKLTATNPAVGYNLILATIFAQGITLAYSLTANLVYLFQKSVLKLKAIRRFPVYIAGLLGSFLLNLAGNLHTIYLFSKGYPNESPIPFWKILSSFNPTKYWYPNATRFIPYTIHEFPSYSYVVADLHGHVFDIPFVLLTLAILLTIFIKFSTNQGQKSKVKSQNYNSKFKTFKILNAKSYMLSAILIGFMTAVHYMTNAFDGPIYFLLSLILFFILFGLSSRFLWTGALMIVSFLIFSLPFTLHFNAFVSGIGVNCAPSFLVKLQRLGPFLFEKGNCQVSPFWMLFVLWGFFWISFLIFVFIKQREARYQTVSDEAKKVDQTSASNPIDLFILIIFAFGILLIVIPEFFYVKDIYPLHFRANTMFKLGYQAFMMMSVGCAFVFYRISLLKNRLARYPLKLLFIALFCLVFLYPFFGFPSYYGKLQKRPQLDGSVWLAKEFPQDKQIIDYLNAKIKGQPVILEAQGDSYTDYERISAYTGLPTVAGWWVHEWLWRGSADVVGIRIPDIVNIYESPDLTLTKTLLRKYGVEYVIVSGFEREKYKNLLEEKFGPLGQRIFRSTNRVGAIYQLK